MNDLPLRAPPASRSPWQQLYRFAHRLRRRHWTTRALHLPRPVISVGNLHWGGSGKTPLVAAIAAHLRDDGRRVAILSRGYGRHDKRVRVVSQGEGPLLGPRLAGDEPVLLAGQLPGVAVVVGPDRHQAGRHALERLSTPPDIFLLDDGFSHLGLARDLDLLAFPAADPFAGGKLPPTGRLREPLASATAADAVLLTGFSVGSDAGDALARALRPHGFGGPGFAAPTVASTPQDTAGQAVDLGQPVLVVCAIARPETFVETVRAAGFTLAGHLFFPDHHRYSEASLTAIAEAFRQGNAARVLTTAKDRVKLQDRLQLPLAEIPVQAEPEPDFFRWLDERLAHRGAD